VSDSELREISTEPLNKHEPGAKSEFSGVGQLTRPLVTFVPLSYFFYILVWHLIFSRETFLIYIPHIIFWAQLLEIISTFISKSCGRLKNVSRETRKEYPQHIGERSKIHCENSKTIEHEKLLCYNAKLTRK